MAEAVVLENGKIAQELMRSLYLSDKETKVAVLALLQKEAEDETAAGFHFELVGNLLAIMPQAMLAYFSELTLTAAAYHIAYDRAIHNPEWLETMKMDLAMMDKDVYENEDRIESTRVFAEIFRHEVNKARDELKEKAERKGGKSE